MWRRVFRQFITDGSTGSFEQNARKLETRLKATGAYVESLYYPAEHGTINHEYQFDFSTPKQWNAIIQHLPS